MLYTKENPLIGNAAGTVKSPLDVAQMCRSGATRITLGSITLKRRTGNLPAPRDTYYYDSVSGASINALGLPNYGMDEYEAILPEMISRASDAGKEFVVSVAGFTSDEFAELAERCLAAGVKRIELNLGCPNVHSTEGRKPIFSHNPYLVEEVVSAVKEYVGEVQMGAKISPVDDQLLLTRVANVLTRSGIVDEIVAWNTIPDQRIMLSDAVSALAFRAVPDGKVLETGGLAGEPLRERTLWGVGQLAQMRLSMRIIAVGGISRGEHVRDALAAGAVGVECATAFIQNRNDPRFFTDLLEAYAAQPQTEPAQ